MRFLQAAVAVLAAAATVASARRHIYFGEDAAGARRGSRSSEGVFEWFVQRNDHFNKQDLSTWKQRYVVNASFWRGNGYPVFVMLGGEGPLSDTELAGHFILDEYAKKLGALMLAVEHRFYGRSIPGDGTLATENLRLLSADQALADYATFIEGMRRKYGFADSKVVTFGGSYSGSLSAWMRQKYPNVVDIAYSSSAPVLAQLDFPEYHQVVTASVGAVCAARLKSAFERIEELMASDRAKLLRDFEACDAGMSGELDEVTFLEALSDAVAGVVQYSGDNNALGRAWTVERMCGLLGTSGDAYDAYVAYSKQFRQSQGENCTDSSYSAALAQLRNTDPNAPGAAGRSWTYQTCTEYGYYQTVESSDVPFSKRITLDYFLRICKDVYGTATSAPARSVDYTNDYYGGRDVRSNRIVFLNGSVDPWHALGLVSDTPKPSDMPVYYIKGTAHCADLYASSSADLPTLQQARQRAWANVQAWLKEK